MGAAGAGVEALRKTPCRRSICCLRQQGCYSSYDAEHTGEVLDDAHSFQDVLRTTESVDLWNPLAPHSIPNAKGKGSFSLSDDPQPGLALGDSVECAHTHTPDGSDAPAGCGTIGAGHPALEHSINTSLEPIVEAAVASS